MADRAPEMMKPTLIAGAIFGALSGLPYLEYINCCTCCGLVWACGFTAAALYSGRCKAAGVAFGPGNGAMVGLIAALFYAVCATVVGVLATIAFGNASEVWFLELMQKFLEWVLQSGGDIPEESLDQIEEGLAQLDAAIEEARSGTGLSAVGVIFNFFGSVLAGAIFSTLGGLIGGVAFKRDPSVPGGPSVGSGSSTGSTGPAGSAESLGSSLEPKDPAE